MDANSLELVASLPGNPLVFKARQRRSNYTKKYDGERPTFIYLAQDRLTGIIKIGKTINMKARFQTLKSTNPHRDMILLACILTENEIEGRFNEKGLQKHFKPKRVRGEWFYLTQADLEYAIDFVIN